MPIETKKNYLPVSYRYGRRIESKSSIDSCFETVCEVTNLLSMTLKDSIPQALLCLAQGDPLNNKIEMRNISNYAMKFFYYFYKKSAIENPLYFIRWNDRPTWSVTGNTLFGRFVEIRT